MISWEEKWLRGGWEGERLPFKEMKGNQIVFVSNTDLKCNQIGSED